MRPPRNKFQFTIKQTLLGITLLSVLLFGAIKVRNEYNARIVILQCGELIVHVEYRDSSNFQKLLCAFIDSELVLPIESVYHFLPFPCADDDEYFDALSRQKALVSFRLTDASTNHLKNLSKLINLRSLSLHGKTPSGDWAGLLHKLPLLDSLHVSTESITKSNFCELLEIEKLRRLSLNGMVLLEDEWVFSVRNSKTFEEFSLSNHEKVDAFFESMPVLVNLKSLSISKGSINNGLGFLRKFPNLETLSLSELNVVDSQLEGLFFLNRLRVLELVETDVTGSGLVALKDCPTLERLVLTGSPVTNEGLSRIPVLPKLSSIDLVNTRIDDDGLSHLAKHKSLTRVELGSFDE